MLQYSSAFDDEVAEVPEDPEDAAELPGFPEGVLECVLEESPEAAEPQPDEESPATQAEPGRPSTGVVHGPYYYFYQGGYTCTRPRSCKVSSDRHVLTFSSPSVLQLTTASRCSCIL